MDSKNGRTATPMGGMPMNNPMMPPAYARAMPLNLCHVYAQAAGTSSCK